MPREIHDTSDPDAILDTSTPRNPARVLQTGESQFSVFKPTGGLVASFVFLRDAEQIAEATFDYVTYGIAEPYAASLKPGDNVQISPSGLRRAS